MIEHLKRLYQEHILTDPSQPGAMEKYDWFQTEDGPVGILKSSLSAKERSLLEMFLTPYFAGVNANDKQALWHRLLFRGEPSSEWKGQETGSFRLIHFYIKDPNIDAESFADAVNGLFPTELTILWENRQEGVLIEPTDSLSDPSVEYHDLADAVTSDFFTDLYLYVGRKQSDLNGAFEQNRKEKGYFISCRRQFPRENVYYHEESIPFLLLENTLDTAKDDLLNDLLGETSGDKELLNSIYQYLYCDMNVTRAAEKLFIHRNSLQYRVDKFIEKTNLDVRSFSQAVTVYFALLHSWNRS